jgi:hypothetical protein
VLICLFQVLGCCTCALARALMPPQVRMAKALCATVDLDGVPPA